MQGRKIPAYLVAGCLFSALFILPFNLLPVLLGSAADSFGLTTKNLGNLGTIALAGWVISSLLYFLFNPKINPRKIVVIGGVVCSIGWIASQFFGHNFYYMAACLFFGGLGTAVPFCVAVQTLGNTGNLELNMGARLATAVLLGAVALYIFPALLVKNWGYAGAAVGLAVIQLLTLLSYRGIQDQPFAPKAAPKTAAGSPPPSVSLTIAIIALGCYVVFFAGQLAIWTFMERIGKSIGVTPSQIGLSFSIVKVFGGAAGITAVFVGGRFGLRWPHFVGVATVGGGMLLLSSAKTFLPFAVGAWIWEFGFALSQTYMMAGVGRLSKRMVALLPLIFGLGAMFGPSIGGYLKGDGASYSPIMIFTFVCTLISAGTFITLMSKRRLDAAAAAMSAAADASSAEAAAKA